MNVDRRCAYLEKKIQDMAEEIERLEKAKTVTHTISPPLSHCHIISMC